MNFLSRPVVLTSAVARCALGDDLATIMCEMREGRTGLRPLRQMEGCDGHMPGLRAGWLHDRSPLKGRRYGAASNLAVHVARDAIARAGWTPHQTSEAWLFGGTSRGNYSELMGVSHGRRPVKLFAPSNTLTSEILAAISVECGIRAPWQMLSNGCASGLDAIIWAAHCVAYGMAPRALVASVELPLAPQLLNVFSTAGLLAANDVNDPYSPQTTGFFPSEAAAALTIEPTGMGSLLVGGWMNSDAFDSNGLPPDGHGLRTLLDEVFGELDAAKPGWNPAICPHATGTQSNRISEYAALRSLLGASGHYGSSVHLMKPFTGHSLGANGALDCAILHGFLSEGQLPPNLPDLTGKCLEFSLPETPLPVAGRTLLKISGAMGGHNAVIAMTSSLP